MVVEKAWDELWVGVKCQSNPVIAGSPRNSFRASLGGKSGGGRALMGCGALPGYQALSNSESYREDSGSQTAGDKLRRREEKSPDRQLRSPSPG